MQTFDVVILGNGVAAQRALLSSIEHGATAIHLASDAWGGSDEQTHYAGIASSLEEDDHVAHRYDTIVGAEYLTDQSVVDVWLREAPRELALLERWGLNTERGADGSLTLTTSLGQSIPRVAHAGDLTGRSLSRILDEQRLKHSAQVRHDWIPLRILLEDGSVRGVVGINADLGQPETILCNSIILAGSGFSGAWTGTGTAWGHILNLAVEAGVPVRGMEFIGEHPLFVRGTTIGIPLSLLDRGAVIRTSSGDVIEHTGHTADELALMMRDAGECVLDARMLDTSSEKWCISTIELLKERFGLNLSDDVIPVEPLPHITHGGLIVDERGRVLDGSWTTWFTGMFAAGDVALSGILGGRSIAGNRLLGSLVSGSLAGRYAAEWSGEHGMPIPDDVEAASLEAIDDLEISLAPKADAKPLQMSDLPSRLSSVMRTAMFPHRNESTLTSGIEQVEEIIEAFDSVTLSSSSLFHNPSFRALLGWRSCARLARLSLIQALARTSSLGNHRRSDHVDDPLPPHHLITRSTLETSTLNVWNGPKNRWLVPFPSE